MFTSSVHYQRGLFFAFAIVWVWAAIAPLDRGNWALENMLVVAFVPVVVLFGRYFRLTNLSMTLVVLFVALHVVGSHWGYAHVPIGDALHRLFGSDRNMYDRMVHFSFGLLLAYPIREIFVRTTGARGFWTYYFPLDIVLSLSALFEIFEWAASVTVHGPLGIAFLGAQGDAWDTQKDMAAAAVGAIMAMLIVAVRNALREGSFREEMRESLRIAS